MVNSQQDYATEVKVGDTFAFSRKICKLIVCLEIQNLKIEKLKEWLINEWLKITSLLGYFDQSKLSWIKYFEKYDWSQANAYNKPNNKHFLRDEL